MEFLDKVANAAKNVGQTVVKTTGGLYDMGKNKVAIAQAQGELRDIFREYGEYIYKAEKAGSVDEAAKADFTAKADALCKRIDDLIESALEARAQEAKEAAERAASKDAPKCPVCGAVRFEGAAYCGSCGTKF